MNEANKGSDYKSSKWFIITPVQSIIFDNMLMIIVYNENCYRSKFLIFYI